MKAAASGSAAMWARHAAEWRDTAQVCSQWREAADVDERLLESRASRGFWRTLAETQATLLVTREYEHLAMALSAPTGHPRQTYFPVPHPSGLTVERATGKVWLASTRNPNQVYTLKPATSLVPRGDVKTPIVQGAPLAVVASTFYPGSLYLHDLAVIGGELYGNAVGHNAVARLAADGTFEPAWWPLCIERHGRPDYSRNYIQLNSIAAGPTLRESYFSASSASMGRLRPGHLNYAVDGRGVIFSGRTRTPIATGLTRPHSARLHDGTIWIANSGYGQVGTVADGRFEPVAALPGWTRGLCIVGDVVFVGTSRIIPKYARYAPGLEARASVCAVHALNRRSGQLLGSLEWPFGNQVFAIDWLPNRQTLGFPFGAGSRRRRDETAFFYTYLTN